MLDRWEQFRQADLMLAFTMLGIPYIWGGQSREGADCSGFQVFRYMQLGILDKDRNAQGLYEYYMLYGYRQEPAAGRLAVYGSDLKTITHIALCITETKTIDAPGGGSLVKEPDPSIVYGIHNIHRRDDLQGFIDPFEHLRELERRR